MEKNIQEIEPIPEEERITLYPAKQQPIIKEAEPGRNDPCPCGSGKKCKQCHLAAEMTADQLKMIQQREYHNSDSRNQK